jgi:hypothetical protein
MTHGLLQASGRRVGTTAYGFSKELEGLVDKVIHVGFDAEKGMSDSLVRTGWQ